MLQTQKWQKRTFGEVGQRSFYHEASKWLKWDMGPAVPQLSDACVPCTPRAGPVLHRGTAGWEWRQRERVSAGRQDFPRPRGH